MNENIGSVHDEWKSLGYVGAGWIAGRLAKAMTGHTFEEHAEAELYHQGVRAESGKDVEKVTLVGALAGTLLGSLTGYLKDGSDGVLEGAVIGGLSGAAFSYVEKKLRGST